MDNHLDPALEMLFSFYERLDRKAPGSVRTTRKALAMLPDLPTNPLGTDMGCGAGESALVLAQAGIDVTAIDVHEPFFRRLRQRAGDVGVADRIRTIVADMAEPPIDRHSNWNDRHQMAAFQSNNEVATRNTALARRRSVFAAAQHSVVGHHDCRLADRPA